MPLIIIIIIAIYLVFICWTWHNLEDVDKIKKIGLIVLGIFILYIITLIIFNFSKGKNINENIPRISTINNILIILFTGINGIIFLPYIAKILIKVKDDIIEQRVLIINVAILLILFIVLTIFEYGYLKDTQKNIINIYNATISK